MRCRCAALKARVRPLTAYVLLSLWSLPIVKGAILPLSPLHLKKDVSPVIKVERWKCWMREKGTEKTEGNLLSSPTEISKSEITLHGTLVILQVQSHIKG